MVTYSRCTLTMPKDKLPALSGVVAKLYEHTKDEYMAGLWKSDLFRAYYGKLIWTKWRRLALQLKHV